MKKLILIIPTAGKTLEEMQAEVKKQLKEKGMMDDKGEIIVEGTKEYNKNMGQKINTKQCYCEETGLPVPHYSDECEEQKNIRKENIKIIEKIEQSKKRKLFRTILLIIGIIITLIQLDLFEKEGNVIGAVFFVSIVYFVIWAAYLVPNDWNEMGK